MEPTSSELYLIDRILRKKNNLYTLPSAEYYKFRYVTYGLKENMENSSQRH